jgi:Fe-S-cluster containining protein
LDPKTIRDSIPFESAVQPQELTLESRFQFRCHKGIACFNACCRNIDITLTPYDILRLKRRLDMRSMEFVARYTIPFEMDAAGLPGLKMTTKPGTGECRFLGNEGCTVYEDRPAACRYYALGNMAVRKEGSAEIEEAYFLVKEPHCLGHDDDQTQTVVEYRHDQGIDAYDEMNREWCDIVLKKRSSGPTVGKPSERSLQLFDMCSYDMDSFREFIAGEGFREIFDLDAEERTRVEGDEDELLKFSLRFLKQVLFGEVTIPLKRDAHEKRISHRRAVWEQRREEEVRRRRESEENLKYE